MTWPARYPGWCPNCRTPFEAGDLIAKDDDSNVHAGCVGGVVDDPLPAVRPGEVSCPACFLIHPEGACDR